MLAAEINPTGTGETVGLVAAFIKATALCLKKYPRLNQRLFHGFFGVPRLVSFDEISCNTVVGRESAAGEPILLPMVLRNVDAMSVSEIQTTIRHYKTGPLEEIEAVGKLKKISKLPLDESTAALAFRRERDFHLKCWNHAVSALPTRGDCTSTFTPVAQTAFFPPLFKNRSLRWTVGRWFEPP